MERRTGGLRLPETVFFFLNWEKVLLAPAGCVVNINKTTRGQWVSLLRFLGSSVRFPIFSASSCWLFFRFDWARRRCYEAMYRVLTAHSSRGRLLRSVDFQAFLLSDCVAVKLCLVTARVVVRHPVLEIFSTDQPAHCKNKLTHLQQLEDGASYELVT